jgi:hypothetical protein
VSTAAEFDRWRRARSGAGRTLLAEAAAFEAPGFAEHQ